MSTLSGRAGGAGFDSLEMTDGTVLAVVVAGPVDAPATVVLQHGWTQDHTGWEDVASLLATRFRVVSLDARGHGRSDAGPRGSATIEQLADDLAEVVEALAPTGPIVFAGHSMGGPVVLALAERHPAHVLERPAGLALVATSAAHIGRDILGLPTPVGKAAVLVAPAVSRLRQLSRADRNSRFPRLLEEVTRLGLYGPGQGTRANRSRTARQIARSHPATTAALATALTRHDRRHVLPMLTGVPTVILGGTRDALTPIAHTRALAAALPAAKLIVYRRSGHMLPYERASEVAGELAELTERIAARVPSDT